MGSFLGSERWERKASFQISYRETVTHLPCRRGWPLTVGEFDEMLCQIPFLQHLSGNERRVRRKQTLVLHFLELSEHFVLLLVL